MVSIKIHKSRRDVVAVCDVDLLGRRFDEGKFQLDLKESFYKGEDMEEKEAEKILESMKREDATFNIVGEEAVECAIKAKVINKNSVGKIAGIPYALVLM